MGDLRDMSSADCSVCKDNSQGNGTWLLPQSWRKISRHTWGHSPSSLSECHFDALADEQLVEILNRLRARDVARMALASKRMRRVCLQVKVLHNNGEDAIPMRLLLKVLPGIPSTATTLHLRSPEKEELAAEEMAYLHLCLRGSASILGAGSSGETTPNGGSLHSWKGSELHWESLPSRLAYVLYPFLGQSLTSLSLNLIHVRRQCPGTMRVVHELADRCPQLERVEITWSMLEAEEPARLARERAERAWMQRGREEPGEEGAGPSEVRMEDSGGEWEENDVENDPWQEGGWELVQINRMARPREWREAGQEGGRAEEGRHVAVGLQDMDEEGDGEEGREEGQGRIMGEADEDDEVASGVARSREEEAEAARGAEAQGLAERQEVLGGAVREERGSGQQEPDLAGAVDAEGAPMEVDEPREQDGLGSRGGAADHDEGGRRADSSGQEGGYGREGALPNGTEAGRTGSEVDREQGAPELAPRWEGLEGVAESSARAELTGEGGGGGGGGGEAGNQTGEGGGEPEGHLGSEMCDGEVDRNSREAELCTNETIEGVPERVAERDPGRRFGHADGRAVSGAHGFAARAGAGLEGAAGGAGGTAGGGTLPGREAGVGGGDGAQEAMEGQVAEGEAAALEREEEGGQDGGGGEEEAEGSEERAEEDMDDDVAGLDPFAGPDADPSTRLFGAGMMARNVERLLEKCLSLRVLRVQGLLQSGLAKGHAKLERLDVSFVFDFENVVKVVTRLAKGFPRLRVMKLATQIHVLAHEDEPIEPGVLLRMEGTEGCPLESLEVEGFQVPDTVAIAFPSLKTLKVYRGNIPSNSYPPARKLSFVCPLLEKLDLDVQICQQSVDCLALSCPRLSFVRLKHPPKKVSFRSTWVSLEELQLGGLGENYGPKYVFLNCLKLRTAQAALGVSRTEELLVDCPLLKELRIQNFGLDRADCSLHCPSLETLCLGGVDPGPMDAIGQGCPALKILEVCCQKARHVALGREFGQLQKATISGLGFCQTLQVACPKLADLAVLYMWEPPALIEIWGPSLTEVDFEVRSARLQPAVHFSLAAPLITKLFLPFAVMHLGSLGQSCPSLVSLQVSYVASGVLTLGPAFSKLRILKTGEVDWEPGAQRADFLPVRHVDIQCPELINIVCGSLASPSSLSSSSSDTRKPGGRAARAGALGSASGLAAAGTLSPGQRTRAAPRLANQGAAEGTRGTALQNRTKGYFCRIVCPKLESLDLGFLPLGALGSIAQGCPRLSCLRLIGALQVWVGPSPEPASCHLPLGPSSGTEQSPGGSSPGPGDPWGDGSGSGSQQPPTHLQGTSGPSPSAGLAVRGASASPEPLATAANESSTPGAGPASKTRGWAAPEPESFCIALGPHFHRLTYALVKVLPCGTERRTGEGARRRDYPELGGGGCAMCHSPSCPGLCWEPTRRLLEATHGWAGAGMGRAPGLRFQPYPFPRLSRVAPLWMREGEEERLRETGGGGGGGLMEEELDCQEDQEEDEEAGGRPGAGSAQEEARGPEAEIDIRVECPRLSDAEFSFLAGRVRNVDLRCPSLTTFTLTHFGKRGARRRGQAGEGGEGGRGRHGHSRAGGREGRAEGPEGEGSTGQQEGRESSGGGRVASGEREGGGGPETGYGEGRTMDDDEPGWSQGRASGGAGGESDCRNGREGEETAEAMEEGKGGGHGGEWRGAPAGAQRSGEEERATGRPGAAQGGERFGREEENGGWCGGADERGRSTAECRSSQGTGLPMGQGAGGGGQRGQPSRSQDLDCNRGDATRECGQARRPHGIGDARVWARESLGSKSREGREDLGPKLFMSCPKLQAFKWAHSGFDRCPVLVTNTCFSLEDVHSLRSHPNARRVSSFDRGRVSRGLRAGPGSTPARSFRNPSSPSGRSETFLPKKALVPTILPSIPIGVACRTLRELELTRCYQVVPPPPAGAGSVPRGHLVFGPEWENLQKLHLWDVEAEALLLACPRLQKLNIGVADTPSCRSITIHCPDLRVLYLDLGNSAIAQPIVPTVMPAPKLSHLALIGRLPHLALLNFLLPLVGQRTKRVHLISRDVAQPATFEEALKRRCGFAPESGRILVSNSLSRGVTCASDLFEDGMFRTTLREVAAGFWCYYRG